MVFIPAARFRFGATFGSVLLILCLQSSTAGVQNWNWAISEGLTKERVIGLLDLPEVVGPECAPSQRARADLYDGPSNAKPATRSIEPPRDENCEILVRRMRNNSEERLPTDESGYETPAAIVYQRSGRWFRIALQQGSAWLTRETPNGFLPYPELLKERLAYLRKGWDGRLWDTPGASASKPLPSKWKSHATENIPLKFLGARRLSGGLWIHVRLETESCGESLEGVKPAEGWLPAYRSSGLTSAWFYSRGC
jgi:hypothetical protein